MLRKLKHSGLAYASRGTGKYRYHARWKPFGDLCIGILHFFQFHHGGRNVLESPPDRSTPPVHTRSRPYLHMPAAPSYAALRPSRRADNFETIRMWAYCYIRARLSLDAYS